MVEGGAHGGCRSTLWMEVLFGTGTWQLLIGYIVLKEEQSMRVATFTHSPSHIQAIACKASLAT